ncbi:MAG: hypothetical protein Q7R35_18115 [Elusimicrobiota bacterium]|nr:hypothetical protein [Elusimicrobiota bacterium]
MIKSLSALLLAFSASPVLAFDLQSVDLAEINKTEPVAVEAPAAAKAGNQYVWMSVRNNPSWKEVEANDWSAQMEARVKETFKDSYSVSLRAGMDSAWGSIRKTGSYYSLSGSGIFLNMSGSNGSYFINGTVTENGKMTNVSVNVSKRFDDFTFNVFGSGLNLYTDRNSINGNYDTDRFSKKSVAGVVSMLLAVQLEKGEPKQEEKSVKNEERIWLTIRPGFGGWNTVEASDPFSRIEVNLRKIFDREYDAEIEIDNNRQWGRVSGFFTRRYELRAGRTDLRMEEWAGRWEITGRVEVQGAQNNEQAVKLEMRDRFGDGSFYIWADGIRLNIDRNSISGDVETKIYPKEVVGAITALVMTYQQINPNPAQQGSPR